MEPSLSCFILCEDVRKDGGKFDVLGVFYRFHTASFPVTCHCCVIVGWCGDAGYYDFGLKFWRPDRKEVLAEVPFYPFTLTAERPYYNAVIKAGLPLEVEGTYWFEIFLSGRKCAEFPLHVLLIGQPGLKM